MQALFKARFEQALDSQKLNIKKIEQQLRRKGVNPEDPIAMASIQRVASTFFRAIDEKQGTPYVFRGARDPTATAEGLREEDDSQQPIDLSPDDSDQEELDRFIAEIEDAADQEWAAEEAAEREEASKIRYWGKEDMGMMRGRNANWRSGDSEEDHHKGHGNMKRTMDIRKWDSGDDVAEASEGDEKWEEDSPDEVDDEDDEEEEDVRVTLSRNRPMRGETFNMQSGGRMSEVSGRSDNEMFGGSEGDDLWESEDEKDQNRKPSKPDALEYHSGTDDNDEENFGNKGQIRGRKIDEEWDSDQVFIRLA